MTISDYGGAAQRGNQSKLCIVCSVQEIIELM